MSYFMEHIYDLEYSARQLDAIMRNYMYLFMFSTSPLHTLFAVTALMGFVTVGFRIATTPSDVNMIVHETK